MKLYFTSFFVILISTLSFAEGSRQLITCPTCEAGLSINDKAQFAYPTIDPDRRLYIRISPDAVNERIYVALSEQWYVQIVSPDGSSKYVYDGTGFTLNGTPAPFPLLGTGRILDYNQSEAGPNGVTQRNAVGPTTGSYNAVIFNPDVPGDWYIEFTDQSDMSIPTEGVRCAYWDISVVDASTPANSVIDGRTWAYQWGMRSGPGSTFPGPGPRLNSTFYIYTDEQVVTSIEVGSPDNPGWGGDWFIACNDFGIIESETPAEARKSINGDADDIYGFLGQYRIFLNDPDIAEFPSGISEIDVSTVAIDICSDGGSFITFNTNVDGVGDITLDFPPYANNGSEDIEFPAQALTAGANTVEWDGLDGNGATVPAGTVFKIRLFIGASIVHLPLYDIEGLTGLKAKLVRPGTPDYIGLYWDNSNILGGTTEVVDPGCISSDIEVCNSYGYANEITLNNWWNGLDKIVEADIVAPQGVNSSIDAGIGNVVCVPAEDLNDTDSILVDLSASTVNVNAVKWTSTGTGTFMDENDPSTSYIASDFDLNTGTVTLTLSGAACPDIADVVTINIPDDICNLPITLVAFKGVVASSQDHCEGVEVTWITATEENTEYFVLLRSSNGIDFSEVGRASAAGNSITETAYTMLDENAGELNYYKLVIVDLDGSQEEILMGGTVGTDCMVPVNTISEMYPNPIREGRDVSLTINLNASANVTVNIVDIYGRTVRQIPMDLIEGINPVQFNMDNLASGTYFINISSNEWKTSHRKLIKLR